jgi:nitrogen fixation NifU-like protein
MGFNPKNREFVIFYLYIEDDKLKNVGYGVNADDNAIVLASMFSQMIKGDTLEGAKETLADMREEISHSPKSKRESADIVLTSFESALINHKNLQNGLIEAMHKLQIS